MARVISTESRTVEFPAVVMYEHDARVFEFFPQPFKIDVVLRGPKGKAGRFQHTPDFLKIEETGIFVDEWREEPRLLTLAMKHPDRYVRTEEGWRCPPVEDHFSDLGLTYRLRSADELPRTLVQNLIFLADYLNPDLPAAPADLLEALRDLMNERPALHLRELLDAGLGEADAIYKAIADGAVSFDLMNDLISHTERVLVFRDEVTMMLHRKVGVPPLGEAVERRDASVATGNLVRYEDKEYVIGPTNRNNVVLMDGDQPCEMPLKWLVEMHRQGKLAVVSRHGEADIVAEMAEKLACEGPDALRVAAERMEWVQRATTSPEDVPRSVRTIQRYRKAIREAEATAIGQHVALMPKFANCGYRERRLPDDVVDLIAKTIQESYNTPNGPNVEWSYMDFVQACQEAGAIPCSRRTFSKEVAQVRSIGKREGKRRAYQASRVVDYLNLKESIHGARPFQYVHIDHTQAQIELRGPDSKKPLGRPWLSVAIDAESRAVVGIHLSFEPPSYRSCMMVLRDIVRRHGRMPDMLILDNGKEFHSAAMRRVCQLYGCDLRYRPAARPRFGSIMERVFGVVQSQLINNLKGNSQILRHAREATKSMLPENFTEWTLPGLHAALEYYFEALYGKEPHSAHGDGPMEHLLQRMLETGERKNRLVRFDDTFLIETCPSPYDGETREVCNRRGVKIHHIWYWDEALRKPHLRGKSIQIRVDPWDVRFVFALVDGGWVRCRSKLAWLTHDYTEVELRCAFEEMAKKHKIQRKDLSPERIAEWMKVRDPKIFDERLAIQQAEARHVYRQLGMANVPEGQVDSSDQTALAKTTPECPLKTRGTLGAKPSPAKATPTPTPRTNPWEEAPFTKKGNRDVDFDYL
jgi:putative transposase